ncbi:MAG TPA: TatD family hydrolase [Steroidobacteraceae bacterium]|nr:TatD family hydrolase [Steroidobacteraceae bacterium]
MSTTDLPLIDIGANLAHDSFDRDREVVIRRAREAGVAAMIVTGSSIDDSARALAVCRQWPGQLRATAGVHPHHAAFFHATDVPRLAELLADPLVVAAGECGLDFYRNFSPPADQRRAFALQLALAAQHDRPLFLHQRDAHADFLAMLAEHPALASRAVIHCFTGGAAELEACLDAGLSIGITGWICDERRGQTLRESSSRIPADRLMIETDAPYLLPRTISRKPRDRRNEPMNLPAVLATLADCRREPAAELARATTGNACRFFGLTLRETVAVDGSANYLLH